jgi:cytoskeletal protein CcmA (bactofilin family)
MSTTNNKNGKRTLVEEGTELKGTMSSKCPIVVMGKVEGDITGPSIEVAEGGIVAGNVNVKELRSSGEIAGHINAEAVYLSGRVRDNTVIRAQTLEVNITRNEGPMDVMFGGACELAIGDEPTRGAEDTKHEDKKPEAKHPVVTIPPVAEQRADTEPNLDGKQRTKQRTQPPPAA